MIIDEKQKEKQGKVWKDRNVHVMKVHANAREIVKKRIDVGDSKADVLLLAELMIDLVKRMD